MSGASPDKQFLISTGTTPGGSRRESFDHSTDGTMPSFHPSPIGGPTVEPPPTPTSKLTPYGGATTSFDVSNAVPRGNSVPLTQSSSSSLGSNNANNSATHLGSGESGQRRVDGRTFGAPSFSGGAVPSPPSGGDFSMTQFQPMPPQPPLGSGGGYGGGGFARSPAPPPLFPNSGSSYPPLSGGSKTKGGGAASTKAVLSALQALQDKIRALEGERDGCTQLIERLRAKVKATEVESTRRIEAELSGARERAARQLECLERLTGDKSGLEERLVRLREEKRELSDQSSVLKQRADELELLRRTAEARWTSHQDRTNRLTEQLKVSCCFLSDLGHLFV